MATFTRQDAQALIALAQRAPLRNMRKAEQCSDMLRRFAAWYDEVTSKPALDHEPESPT